MRIREYRFKTGMTQVQLAKKMNVDQSAVSLWESGKTKPLKKCQKKLAKVLGITLEELLREGEENAEG
jgi:ribosome-binding protein aMBF1 (putative translation factor)